MKKWPNLRKLAAAILWKRYNQVVGRKYQHFPAAIFAILLLIAPAARAAGPLIEERRPAMGGVAHIMAYGRAEEPTRKALAAAFLEIARLEKIFSPYDKESELFKVNSRAAKEPVKISKEFQGIIVLAQEVAKKSGGSFDISFAALNGLWHFPGPGAPAPIPPAYEIAARRPLVGYQNIVLNPEKSTIFFQKEGMAIGLSSLVKGYAAERAGAILKAAGVSGAMVSLSGDIYSFGDKGGEKWLIGIKDPRGEGYFATLELLDEAIVTSGDYERYFEKDGQRYHHILDPKSGYPAQGVRQVTITGPNGALADALATAVMVLGANEGLKLLAAYPAYGAIIIDNKNELYVTQNLKKRLYKERAPTP